MVDPAGATIGSSTVSIPSSYPDTRRPARDADVFGTPVRALASNGLGLFYANIDGKLVVTDQPGGIRGFKNDGKPLSESAQFKDAADASGLPGKTYGFLLRPLLPDEAS